MYASLHTNDASLIHSLLEIAHRFSPGIEYSTAAQAVTFCITQLRKLLGSPHQIASEICRAGNESKVQANLAIASNPDTAILLSRHYSGVTLVTPGEERFHLAAIPLVEVFTYDPVKLAPSMLEMLLRWGVKTCEDLASLPEKGVLERLGPMGVYLRNLAYGRIQRPLRIQTDLSNFELKVDLEHSLHLLEPLLFLLSRAIGELCALLRSQSQAARELRLQLHLETQLETETKIHTCRLEFPVPIQDPRTILKLVQLHLERHSPHAPVLAFQLQLEPVAPKRVQKDMFLPPAPVPEKLHVTLARIANMVGVANVGTPMLLDTHRPDAFVNNLLPGQSKEPASLNFGKSKSNHEMFHLAMRIFRPALPAQVRLTDFAPVNVAAQGVKGEVMRYAGPWKTIGEWWGNSAWSREEWDVALNDGAVYRIYQESNSNDWFVHGVYD